jgi:hypothetical protein
VQARFWQRYTSPIARLQEAALENTEVCMSVRLIAAALAFTALAGAAPLGAQTSSVHGAWLGGGIGTASARVNCDACTTDRNGGMSGYLSGGLAVARGVRAGAELAGWFDTTNDVSQRLALYGASL